MKLERFMAYVIERFNKDGVPRYVGMYTGTDGKKRSAGTYGTHERAYEVAREEENHITNLLNETSPADKAKMTIEQFGQDRFFPRHAVGPQTLQGYASTARNHIYPYLGHIRISETKRETFYNHLIKVLPSLETTQSAILHTRKVLSALCQMAYNEGYRDDNPVRSIRISSSTSPTPRPPQRRQLRRTQAEKRPRTRADPHRRDGTEFLSHQVWERFWRTARTAAGLPDTFTAYNARHTGISWAIAKGIDLQRLRQQAGHGSLSVTSRYAAILNDRDTTLADTLEEIFDTFAA